MSSAWEHWRLGALAPEVAGRRHLGEVPDDQSAIARQPDEVVQFGRDRARRQVGRHYGLGQFAELQARRAEPEAVLDIPIPQAPSMPADMATVYRDNLAHLSRELAGPDHTEAREAARALIDKVIVSPPTDPDDRPSIELVGDLSKLLQTAGLVAKTPNDANITTELISTMQSSVQEGPRAWTLVGDPARRRVAGQEPRLVGKFFRNPLASPP